MAKLISTGLGWVIHPDQPITRRKWRHLAHAPETGDGFADARFGAMIDAILEHDPAQIVLKLPSGRDCVISRVPRPRKDLD